MQLVMLYGAPGVGKLMVAQALADLTGYKVLHNQPGRGSRYRRLCVWQRTDVPASLGISADDVTRGGIGADSGFGLHLRHPDAGGIGCHARFPALSPVLRDLPRRNVVHASLSLALLRRSCPTQLLG